MDFLKLVLLVFAYSMGLATLVVQVVCYLKGLEYKETIAFSFVFLLLIAASTIQILFKTDNAVFAETQQIVVQFLTVTFAVSIPINIHKERVYKQRKLRNLLVIIAGFMVLAVSVFLYINNRTLILLLLLSAHMFLSVVYSMLFILFTKPGTLIQPREKRERVLAFVVLVIMLLTFVLFVANIKNISVDILPHDGGFVLAIICIMLSGSKLVDDIKKLLHRETLSTGVEVSSKTLRLTPREHDVSQLLIQGKTYKEMADELFVSLPTIKTHVSNIYAKAKVRNRLELSNLLRYSQNSE